MKNIKIFKVLSLAVLLTGATACTDNFEEINTNVNAPTFDKAAPDQLLTNAIESMTDRVHEIFLGHEMGSGWVQHMAKVQYTDEDRYIYRPDVVSATWNSFYAASGADATLIYKVGEARLNPNYQGVALVIKSYLTSVLTDLFGDVPYSKAWNGAKEDGGILSPEYDTQESIYKDLIAKLDEANTLLDAEGPAIAGDILFGNDITKWKKFANSLRLRLLLRMSARDVNFVTAEMTKIVGAPGTYPIFESNDEHAALVYLGSAPNNNPINENRKGRDDHRVSRNLIDMLFAKNDARILVYALPNDDDEFVGLPNGLTSAAAAAFNGNGLKFTSKIGDYFTEASAPGMLMSYAELQFILAEASKRGLITGNGDVEAQAYYEAGVEASFEQFRTKLEEVIADEDAHGDFGAPATVEAAIADVLAASPYSPGTALQVIAEQKYLAMFDQGLQSWFEWRRTGFPVLTPAVSGENGGKIPVRVPYPPIEATRNGDNMNAAIARQGTDDLNTRVWWDVN